MPWYRKNPHSPDSSQAERSAGSKKGRGKKVPGKINLIDEVTARGMANVEELSRLFGKSSKKIQQQLGNLSRKNFLEGWFSEDKLTFITREYIIQELTRYIAKGIIDFEKIKNQTSLSSKIIEQEFQQLMEKTHLKGLYTIDRKKFISALAIWLILEENLKTDRVEIPSIAGHLNIPIDDTVKLISQIVGTKAPHIVVSGMTLLTPKYLAKLRTLIDEILDSRF